LHGAATPNVRVEDTNVVEDSELDEFEIEPPGDPDFVPLRHPNEVSLPETDEFYVLFPPTPRGYDKTKPDMLMRLTNGIDVNVWVKHLDEWAPAWRFAMDAITYPYADSGSVQRLLTVQEVENTKTEVPDIPDDVLARWAAQ